MLGDLWVSRRVLQGCALHQCLGALLPCLLYGVSDIASSSILIYTGHSSLQLYSMCDRATHGSPNQVANVSDVFFSSDSDTKLFSLNRVCNYISEALQHSSIQKGTACLGCHRNLTGLADFFLSSDTDTELFSLNRVCNSISAVRRHSGIRKGAGRLDRCRNLAA